MAFGIDVAELEERRRNSRPLTAPTARGLGRVEVGGPSVEVALDGRGSRKPLMRPPHSYMLVSRFHEVWKGYQVLRGLFEQ